MTTEPDTVEQIRDAKKEDVAEENRSALVRTKQEFGLTLDPRVQWRATARKSGNIEGLEHVGTLTILCTDGVVAWFSGAAGHDRCTFFGHIQHFDGEVRPAHSLPNEKTTSLRKEPKKKHRAVAPLEEALRILMNGK